MTRSDAVGKAFGWCCGMVDGCDIGTEGDGAIEAVDRVRSADCDESEHCKE